MLTLTLTITALIGGAILMGRAYASDQSTSNPLVALGFSICTGQPCFKDVVPGVTSWEDTKSIMRNYMRHNSIGGIDGVVNQLSFGFGDDTPTTAGPSGHVTILGFAFYVSGLRVPSRHAIELFGLPCYTVSSKNAMTLIYPTFEINVFGNSNLDAPIDKIYLFSKEYLMPHYRGYMCH